MRRRKSSSALITLLVVAIFSASLGYMFGYYTYNRQPEMGQIDNNDNNDINPDEDEPNITDRAVTTEHETVNNETKLILRTFYERSNDYEEKLGVIQNEMIGLNEVTFNDYILENMPKYNLLSFSKEEIVLLTKTDQIFPGYYLVTEKNGFVVVYKYKENGERSVFKDTRIPISILPPLDQEKLKNGIIKKSEEEVTSLLEDYS